MKSKMIKGFAISWFSQRVAPARLPRKAWSAKPLQHLPQPAGTLPESTGVNYAVGNVVRHTNKFISTLGL
ncbi:hypothetical protein [Collimonas sp. PA-H2]|uniref:hypothetical protein n=1 Tax=Collimonas sp. PA-H2 TaxID=1881062 RepID=UPI00117BE1AF|nr:hypothetical protein [Collimonas sp. PA-H2]